MPVRTAFVERGVERASLRRLVDDVLGDVAAEIARIAPALRRAFPDIPPPVELPPELARRYVWNSLSEFIGRAAHDQIGSTASGRGTVCLVSWKRSSCVTCTIKLRRCSRS